DRVAFPAAFGQIGVEPRSQSRASPEEGHVFRKANVLAIVPADELWHRQPLDIPRALLNDQIIDDDVIARRKSELIEHQVDPIRAERVLAVQQRQICLLEARPIAEYEASFAKMNVLEAPKSPH